MATLTHEQAEVVARRLHPMMGYLCRLRERMTAVGFIPSDQLYQLVSEAEDTMHSLWVTLHYMSVGSGVGESPGK